MLLAIPHIFKTIDFLQIKQFQQFMQSYIETQPRNNQNNGQYLQLKRLKKDESQIKCNYDSDISPWNSEQYESILKPLLIEQPTQKQQNKRSKKITTEGKKAIFNSLTISKDFFKILKKQKRQNASLSPKRQTLPKMKLVNVNLEEQILSRQLKHGRTIQLDNKNSIQPQKLRYKQQPVRMKILKRILNKNMKQCDLNNERYEQFSKDFITSRGKTIDQRQITCFPAGFQHILRDHGLSTKYANLDKYGLQYLPKIDESILAIKKQITPFICQGEIILKEDFYSKKRAKLKHFHLKDKAKSEKQQKLLFLQQFSSQI